MRATVSLDDFRSGRLPPVCVRTGEPTSHLVRADALAVPKPEVLGLMTLLGGLGGFAAGFSRGVRGRLPMTEGAATRHAIPPAVQVAALVTFGVACVGVMAGAPGAFVLVPVAVAAFAGATLLRLVTSLSARVDPGGDTVTIARAHPRFAAAARVWGTGGGESAAPD